MTNEKLMLSQNKDAIELIQGHTKILLIAPHGVETEPYDDIGTAELTRQIQKHLGCSAVINTGFRKATGKKPEKRNNGVPNFMAKVLNLNLVEQAEQVMDFTDKIKKVVDTKGLTYVFWIHGIDDGNIEKIGKDVQCLLGYGQSDKKGKPHLTAEQATIDTVSNEFEKNGIKTIPAPQTSNYRGWKKTYMNQWFLLSESKHTQVQSIQLEFKKTGCRRKEDLETMAEKIANSISALVIPVEKIIEPADKKELPADNAQVPEKITDPGEVKDAIDVGETVYDPLVETAYQKLSNIFSENYEQALMEAGQYIVRTFYGGEKNIEDQDYDKNFEYSSQAIDNARDKNSPLDGSLHQLYAKISDNKTTSTPSQAWIYNSVNLVVQWQDMEKELKNDFYTYRNLLLSHKIALLQVKKIEDKQKYIGQIQKQKLSVRDLKGLIAESKNQPNAERSIYSLIKDPDELFSDKYSEKFKLKELNTIRIDKLKKIEAKMFEQCKIHERLRMKYSNLAYKCDSYVEEYLDILTDIKTVIDYKENPSKDKKLKKSKTKMARP